MIDYSVYLTGNPMDEMAPDKAYARAQMSESMTFDKACPDTLTDAYADVFRAGRPRPYRFNY